MEQVSSEAVGGVHQRGGGASRVDGFEVDGVAHDVELIMDPVAAQGVPASPRHPERLHAGVALEHGDHLRGRKPFVLQPPNPEAPLLRLLLLVVVRGGGMCHDGRMAGSVESTQAGVVNGAVDRQE